MSCSSDQDPLCYPGTDVLRNQLDLRDQTALQEFEQAAFMVRAATELPIGNLDCRHYRALHRYLFSDVYIWAGEYRTVNVTKGGIWFCYHEDISYQLNQLFRQLETKNQLCDLEREAFVSQAAQFLACLHAIHPFREGNGRTLWVFFSLLAANAGFAFNELMLTPERVSKAMTMSFRGELGPLISLVRDLTA